MLKLNSCTFDRTGKNYTEQYWRQCLDCFSDNTEGACLNCIQICHNGHRLGPLRHGGFFCDCGANRSCSYKLVTKDNPKKNYPQNKPQNPRMPFNHDEQFGKYHPYQPIQPNQPYQPPIFRQLGGTMFNKSFDQTDQFDQTNIISHNSHFSQISNSIASKLANNMTNIDYVLSPTSITFALCLLYLGAQDNTKNELSRFFGGNIGLRDLEQIHSLLNNDVINLVNCLFVKQENKIKSSYKQPVANLAIISNENFNNGSFVATKINKFIETNTRGLINNIIDPSSITSQLALILINVIYFKANWKNKFNKNDTTMMNFKGLQNRRNVKMMNQTDDFMYYENNDTQLLEMDYCDNNFSMGILLRKDNQLIKFNDSTLNSWINSLRKTSVNVYLPRFTQRKRINLKGILSKLGLSNLFKQYDANLSGITDNIYVSEVLHEAIVIVDEEGTEAAAVTAVIAFYNCVRKEPRHVIFKADHSFTYYVRHKPTNTILFIGQYI